MGIRMRPMGTFEVEEETVQVTCCSCRERFAISRKVARTTCPECGSMVALHRLRMPAMPTGQGDQREGVVRLRAVTGGGEALSGSADSRGAHTKRVPMLENGEPSVILEAGDRGRSRSTKLPFATRAKIEARRRELFEEPAREEPASAAVRRPLRAGGPILAGTPRSTKVLAISLAVFVVLMLVAVIVALRNDGPPQEKPAAHAGE